MLHGRVRDTQAGGSNQQHDDTRSRHLWQHKPAHRSELFTKAHELELLNLRG